MIKHYFKRLFDKKKKVKLGKNTFPISRGFQFSLIHGEYFYLIRDYSRPNQSLSNSEVMEALISLNCNRILWEF